MYVYARNVHVFLLRSWVGFFSAVGLSAVVLSVSRSVSCYVFSRYSYVRSDFICGGGGERRATKQNAGLLPVPPTKRERGKVIIFATRAHDAPAVWLHSAERGRVGGWVSGWGGGGVHLEWYKSGRTVVAGSLFFLLIVVRLVQAVSYIMVRFIFVFFYVVCFGLACFLRQHIHSWS